MRYSSAHTEVVFSSGADLTEPSRRRSICDNGWTVETFGVVEAGGLNHGARWSCWSRHRAEPAARPADVGAGHRPRAGTRQLEQRTGELHHQALHDALTGLPNRALIMDRIEQLLARDRRDHDLGALLFLDLDDFKNVNDTLGHGAGDQLLDRGRRPAVRAPCARPTRSAGWVATSSSSWSTAARSDVAPELVAQRLLDVMRQPFELDDASMPLTVNISIGIATGDRGTAGELLRDADVALYQAKAAGKNRYEIFDPEMQTSISRRIDLEFDLRSALTATSSGWSTSRSTTSTTSPSSGSRRCCAGTTPRRGDRARRVHPHPRADRADPRRRPLGPARGLSADGDLARPRRHARRLGQRVGPPARRRRHRRRHPRRPRASGLTPTALIIEVTETALMHNVEATAERLRAIKELGVRIAVDDFGTGYSSLAYLQQFPVDCLKIDRAFTNAVTTSPESQALIGTLVQLGRDLGLTHARRRRRDDRGDGHLRQPTSTRPRASCWPGRSTRSARGPAARAARRAGHRRSELKRRIVSPP